MKNLIIAAAFAFSVNAAADVCKLTTDRQACPGVDSAKMLKPYNGQNPTTKEVAAASKEECSQKAEKDSKIVRKKELASKTTTASWGGSEIGKFSDKSDCK